MFIPRLGKLKRPIAKSMIPHRGCQQWNIYIQELAWTVSMHMGTQTKRPYGCAFDAYGADEATLRDLTCDSCLVSGMVCEYRGLATLTRLAKIIDKDGRMNIVSKP